MENLTTPIFKSWRCNQETAKSLSKDEAFVGDKILDKKEWD